jgi:chromosome segregation ATPase
LKRDETHVLQAEVDGLREQLALLKDERDDLRRRLDSEAEERRRLTALLTDQRPAAQPDVRRGWWRQLRGK